MVSSRIIELDLGSNIQHIATDWEIATDRLFANVILSSIEDHINKTNIVFNEVLDPTVKYYGRARTLLDPGGYTIWGNIDIFTPKDISEVELDKDMPSNVTIPTMTLNDNPDNFPLSIFKVNVSGFNVVGPARLTAVSWIIEDDAGNTVWDRLNYQDTLDSILVTDVVLEPNKIYRLKAKFHSSSNDASQFVTKTVTTMKSRFIKVVTDLDNADTNNAVPVYLFHTPGIVKTEWELYKVVENGATLVWNAVRDSAAGDDQYSATIPSGKLQSGGNYIMKIKSDLNNDWSYELFNLL